MRNNRIRDLLIVALALLASVVAGRALAETRDLHLRERVLCAGPELTVGEIVTEGSATRLASVTLMKSPEPGKTRRVSRNRLERMLRDKGWAGRLVGPVEVELGTPGVELDLEALRRPVEVRLEELLGQGGYRLESAPEGWPESLVLSSSHLRWTVAIERAPRGRAAVARLELEDRAGFTADCRLRLTCAQPRTVPVAGAHLKPGDALETWVFQERDGLGLDGRPLTADELGGAVAKGYLEPGDALTDRNTEPTPLVRKGREVTIRLERGAVSVCLTGIAQRDGAFGEIVSVRHLDTRRLRRYRVTGPNTVAPTYVDTTGDKS